MVDFGMKKVKLCLILECFFLVLSNFGIRPALFWNILKVRVKWNAIAGFEAFEYNKFYLKERLNWNDIGG